MEKAVIFNIQKFSLHDGPGIRTVIFFKGCPLRCKWCANPESQYEKIQILWSKDKCNLCGKCTDICSRNAISLTKEQVHINYDSCISCGQCVNFCPTQALKLEGEYMSVSELMRIVMQDFDFYEESGGGVTFSGGEVLTNTSFALTLINELKKNKINIAVETTGFGEAKDFDAIANNSDLLLFDIKHWDNEKHICGTGVGNKLILDNLKRAVINQVNVLPRIPVIPEFNDSLEDAAEFSKLLNSLGLTKAQLLPFHQFGENKYSLLGVKYLYKNYSALHEENLSQYKNIFIDNGIEAFF